MTRRIRAVLFDLDDTLIDWSDWSRDWPGFNRPRLARIYRHLMDTGYRGSVSEETFCHQFNELSEGSWANAAQNGWRSPNFANLLWMTLEKSGFPVATIDLEDLMRVYNWRQMPGVVRFPESVPVLSQLKEQGYRLGLLTNSYFPMWMRAIELRAYGLLDFFDACITSGETGWLKPHPAVFWRLMGRLDLLPDQAVFVGDSPTHDIAGANGVGLTSVLHAPPGLDRSLDGVRPDFTIANLSQLLPILAALEEEP